ncbi:Gamma-aminobutyric acid type B receptor subunit 2 [Lamellibrachia satsuma]|nr:Gamma-aminobutyric acid type B receptor subunit 2 [Lamellibrachia satsuma]
MDERSGTVTTCLLNDLTRSSTRTRQHCDMAVGTKLFFDMMHDPPTKIMLFGDACSHVTAPIAESSVWWNIWQLSYADTNPLLSNRKRYPNFFRTVPSDGDYNPARISFIRHFNWTRVGTLFQDASRGSARYAYAHDNFIALLDKANITRVTQSFSTDPEPALKNLKGYDIRIIFGNFDAEMARKVFCAAVKEKMYGPSYTWMLLGDYPDRWWQVDDPTITCTPDQLREALDGYFSTDVLRLSTSGRRTISTLTAAEYNKLYDSTRGGNYSKFHGYAYDGIWVIAKAIDTVIRENGGQYNLRDFRGESIQRALNDTDFEGVTGRVLFGNGDRIGNLVYQQLQGGEMKTVGEYSHLLGCLDFTKGRDITWRGVGPPRDGTVIEKQLVRVNLTIYVILCTIAGLGIVVAVSFLAINIRFRKHKYIKMSSPNLNNIITIGCVLTYTSVFLLGTDSRLISSDSFHIMCAIRAWVLSFGFTLSFGAMFSKTWRVHAIFTNIKLNKKVIKDYRLFFMVGVFLVVDCLILGAWQSIDPPVRQVIYLQHEVGESGADKEIIPVVEFCISKHMTTWLGIIYAYKGLLLVFGCFLAWETRHVTIPALNDSKYIGMSVYNVVIICVSGVAVAAIIENDPNSAFLILSTFIIFCTTVTLCLVFVPKVGVIATSCFVFVPKVGVIATSCFVFVPEVGVIATSCLVFVPKVGVIATSCLVFVLKVGVIATSCLVFVPKVGVIATSCLVFVPEVGVIATSCLVFVPKVGVIATSCLVFVPKVGVIATSCLVFVPKVGVIATSCIVFVSKVGVIATSCLVFVPKVGVIATSCLVFVPKVGVIATTCLVFVPKVSVIATSCLVFVPKAGVIATSCIVFVPKIIELRKDPVGSDRRIRATLRKTKCAAVDSNSSVMQDDIRHLMQENARYKQILEEVSACDIRLTRFIQPYPLARS